MKKKISIFVFLFVLYVVIYAVFRSQRVERWDKDGNDYVIFPENQRWVYYFYRPVTYLDGMLTGMRFHIGPHR